MAVAIINCSTLNFPKLKGCENYLEWRDNIKKCLMSQNYWSCIKGYAKNDPTSYEEKNAIDCSARILICRMVEPHIEFYIRLTKLAKQAWTALKQAFDEEGANHPVSLQALCAVKLENYHDMQDYLNSLMFVALRLSARGKPISDEILGVLLMQGLTSDYQPLIANLCQSNTNMSCHFLRTKLMQAPNYQAQKNTNNDAASVIPGQPQQWAKRPGERTRSQKCRVCGRWGHTEANCFKAKAKISSESSLDGRENQTEDRSLDQRNRTSKKLHGNWNYEEAEAAYTDIIKLYPECAATYSKRADCYMMLGKYDKALTDAKKCVAINPTLIEAHIIAMKCSVIVGDIVGARSALSQVLVLDPNDNSIAAARKQMEHLEKFSKEANIAYAQKNYLKVVDCMDRCCEVSPSCVVFKLRKAECLTLLEQEATKKANLVELKMLTIDQLYENEEYEDALRVYTEIIEIYPEVPEHYCSRADCYAIQKKYPQALADAKKSISVDPTYLKGYAKVMKYSLIVGNIPEARSAMTKALELDPYNSSISFERSNLEYVEKLSREAEEAYTQKNYHKVIYCMNRCCEVSTSCSAFIIRKEECLAFLEVEAKKKARSASQQNDIANQHYNNKRYNEALAGYTAAIELSPECASYYNNRAACYIMLGKYQSARVDARRSVTIDATNARAHARLIKCMLIEGDIREAKFALSKALELHPDDSGILAEQSRLEFVEKFSKEADVAYAKKDYRKVVDAINRCCEVSTSCRAFMLRKTECERFLKEEAQKTAKLVESKNALASQYYKAKKYSAALDVYTDIIKLSPESPVPYSNRSACYTMLGKYQEALVDARKCITIDPKFVKGHAKMAKCSLVMGNISQAKLALTKALELDPNNSDVLATQKRVQEVEKLLRMADKAYADEHHLDVVFYMERCCQVSTSCPAFKIRKAESLISLKRFEEAQQIAKNILLIERRNVEAIYIYGLCLYYRDAVDKACEKFEELFRLAPDHSKAQDIFKKAKTLKRKKEEGTAALKLKNYTEAWNLYTEALAVDPRNNVANARLYFNRAVVHAKLKEFKKCIRECTKALELNKKYLKALLRRAACHTELKDFEAAVSDYEKACEIDASDENERLLLEAELALEKSTKTNYYKILGIDKNATADAVKQAYRKKALAHHPDKHVNASNTLQKRQERKFKLVDEAYRTLSDPQKRLWYNRRPGIFDEF